MFCLYVLRLQLIDFCFDVIQCHFLLISVIFSVKTVAKYDTKITEKEKQVLTFIINNGPSKVIEISNALGFSITTIKNILYKLVDDGLISSSGTIKDKRYFANKN